jgi:hypothetical protein
MIARIDDIFGDLDSGGDMIAALPVHENETMRNAICKSIECSGIQATGEHWSALMDTIGPAPQAYIDSQTLAEQF